MQKWFKNILILLIFLAYGWSAVDVYVSTVDNIYDSTTLNGNWEIRQKYVMQVRLYNAGGSAQNFNRVEANLDFDATKFELVSQSDKISNWTGANFFIVTNGHVQYQRAANTSLGQAAISIPAGGYYTIYELVLRVKDVPTGTTPFNLDANFSHVLYLVSDLTGSLHSLIVTVVNDISPPVTAIVPAGNMHASSPVTINLYNDPNQNTNCSDLKEIRYTLDGSTPNLSSAVYTTQIIATANQITTLKWFGVDVSGNQEAVRSTTYQVDTIKPTITNVSTLPVDPIRLRTGGSVDVFFSAADNIQLQSAIVRVGGNDAALIAQNGSNYQYRYTVTEQTDGTRNISIQVIDHAGNTTTDTQHNIFVDNTKPTFRINSITPASANIGTLVLFTFTASEELNYANSTVNIGLNSPATFVSKTGTTYSYQRLITGTESSGWIMLYGRDLAGNVGYNLDSNDRIRIYGNDTAGNYGESTATLNILY